MNQSNIQSLLKEIRFELSNRADPALVKKYARYFFEGYDAYGVDLKAMRLVREKWFQDYQSILDMEGFLHVGDQLVQSGKYEEGFIAMGLVSHFSREFTPQVFERFGRWLENGLCNWAHVDSFSSDILPSFIKQHIVPLSAFSSWRESTSKWKRRAIPVTMIKLLTNGHSIPELLAIIDPMMDDKEKVVHQGLGWFLREVWKISPAPVEDFLMKWKDQCARLIIQYATEKMEKDQKTSYKRNPIKKECL
jgi:3-methyladenine DNA glycosylase AlkD